MGIGLILDEDERGSSDFPFVVVKIIKDQLYHLNVHKYMRPNRIQPRILKELV